MKLTRDKKLVTLMGVSDGEVAKIKYGEGLRERWRLEGGFDPKVIHRLEANNMIDWRSDGSRDDREIAFLTDYGCETLQEIMEMKK